MHAHRAEAGRCKFASGQRLPMATQETQMIIRDRPSGPRLLLVLRGSILSRIWSVLAINVGLAIVVTIAHGAVLDYKVTLTPIPFTLMGLALAIFLGFRNNTAYDRYWEGRKQWGRLVATSRTLARQCQVLTVGTGPADAALGNNDVRIRIIYRAIAFAHALRHSLRGSSKLDELEGLLPEEEWQQLGQISSATNFLMLRMGVDLHECLQQGWIDDWLAANMDFSFSSMIEVATACERIKNTPIPFSYTLLLHRTAYLYCFLLPFGLVDSIGVMTPVVVAIVAYTFFGLDALGDEIEEPFGVSPNDLPLNAICRTIEIDLREAIHDRHIPPPLLPVNYRLT
jgi:putative membrane protein